MAIGLRRESSASESIGRKAFAIDTDRQKPLQKTHRAAWTSIPGSASVVGFVGFSLEIAEMMRGARPRSTIPYEVENIPTTALDVWQKPRAIMGIQRGHSLGRLRRRSE